MYCEVPPILRCCFCVPLRYGILFFGYLNLLISGLIISLICIYFDVSGIGHVPINGVILIRSHFAIPLTLYCLEFIFNIALIIGSHKKNATMLKVFYYYGITSTVATFLMFCIEFSSALTFFRRLYDFVIYICLAFAGLVLQCYLIILVKNEIKKLENNQCFHFINHAADSVVIEAPSTDVIYRDTTEQVI